MEMIKTKSLMIVNTHNLIVINQLIKGVDRVGGVYYRTSGRPHDSNYTDGVSFYKLYCKNKPSAFTSQWL
jgi:hypothetical protein